MVSSWVRVRVEGARQAHYEERPAFVPGWGILIKVLGPDGPEAGAELRSLDGNSLLGTTDGTGYVVIESSQRLTQVRVSKGCERCLLLNLPKHPFKECRLPW